jgi:hypothetical protein
MRKALCLLFLFSIPLLARSAEKVTVEQLEHTPAAAHGKKDQDVAIRLGGMELTGRKCSREWGSAGDVDAARTAGLESGATSTAHSRIGSWKSN